MLIFLFFSNFFVRDFSELLMINLPHSSIIEIPSESSRGSQPQSYRRHRLRNDALLFLFVRPKHPFLLRNPQGSTSLG